MKLSYMLAVATAVGGFAAAPAFAQEQPAPAPAPAEPEAAKPDPSGFYVGAAISSLWLDKEYAASGLPVSFEDQVRLPALTGRLGYTVNEYFAVEVDASFGPQSTDYGYDNDNVLGDIRLKTAFGAHVVATIPTGGGYYLMGRAGVETFEVERSYLGSDTEDLSDSGASYGLGFGFREGSLDVRGEFNFLAADGADGFFGLAVAHHF